MGYSSLALNHRFVLMQYCSGVECKGRVQLTLLTHWGRDKMAHHFADDIFKCIFLYENVLILIKISLNFIPKGPINNIPALVEIMAWRQPGDKPLSEPMVVILLTHIYVIRPQWVKSSPPGQNGRFTDDICIYIFVDEKFHILIKISLNFVPEDPIHNDPALFWIMAWRQMGDKPLSEPMLTRLTDSYMWHKGEMSY